MARKKATSRKNDLRYIEMRQREMGENGENSNNGGLDAIGKPGSNKTTTGKRKRQKRESLPPVEKRRKTDEGGRRTHEFSDDNDSYHPDNREVTSDSDFNGGVGKTVVSTCVSRFFRNRSNHIAFAPLSMICRVSMAVPGP